MKTTVLAGCCLALAACSPATTISERESYVLYRSGGALPEMPIDSRLELEKMRIHVATFNAANGDAYNQDNCRVAAALFGGQPSVTARYWCEKGFYRP